ncbi:MAG: hypothetical protein Q4A54_05350 [Parabacteroides sp.]|nr:hypothetical protein [Parabacteroides sp.]
MENKLNEPELNIADAQNENLEEAIVFFLEDEFFAELEKFLIDEDYAMAKDAVKGLYVLASELKLFELYQALLEIYEDLEVEFYNDVMNHYDEMMVVYRKLKKEYIYHA